MLFWLAIRLEMALGSSILVFRMTLTAQEQIIDEALSLPKKARERLVKELRKSLEPAEKKISRKEWNAALKVELNHRIADIESGRVKCIPHAEVRKRLDRILRRA